MIFEQNRLVSIMAEAHNEPEWQRHITMKTWCLVGDDFASALDHSGSSGKEEEARGLNHGGHGEK